MISFLCQFVSTYKTLSLLQDQGKLVAFSMRAWVEIGASLKSTDKSFVFTCNVVFSHCKLKIKFPS